MRLYIDWTAGSDKEQHAYNGFACSCDISISPAVPDEHAQNDISMHTTLIIPSYLLYLDHNTLESRCFQQQ